MGLPIPARLVALDYFGVLLRGRIIHSIAPKLVPYRDGLYMVLLQPLLLKNISLPIFKDFLFSNNFNSVAIVDFRAPNRGHAYMEQVMGL